MLDTEHIVYLGIFLGRSNLYVNFLIHFTTRNCLKNLGVNFPKFPNLAILFDGEVSQIPSHQPQNEYHYVLIHLRFLSILRRFHYFPYKLDFLLSLANHIQSKYWLIGYFPPICRKPIRPSIWCFKRHHANTSLQALIVCKHNKCKWSSYDPPKSRIEA